LNNNNPVFLHPAFFWTWIFSGSQTDPCFQNKNSGCRLTGRICQCIKISWVVKFLTEDWKFV
jgi:hypothetical protein